MSVLIAAYGLFIAGCGPSTSGQTTPAPGPGTVKATVIQTPVAQPAAQPAAPAPLAEWKPDPALLEQLGDYQDFEGYQIRIPKECEEIPCDDDDPAIPAGLDVKCIRWGGPPHTVGNRFVIECVIERKPGHAALSLPSDDVLDKMFSGVDKKSSLVDVKRTPKEIGRIGGMPCIKISFRGRVKKEGYEPWEFHGTDFIIVDGNAFIRLWVVDAAFYEDSLPLGAASILTFRKK